ncbi:hypothetical protein WJ09_24865 [Burkholderia vietnamiensis]|nr:hypothetical protein WJ09_24865 [Burkholderia vietnamiensis]
MSELLDRARQVTFEDQPLKLRPQSIDMLPLTRHGTYCSSPKLFVGDFTQEISAWFVISSSQHGFGEVILQSDKMKRAHFESR